VHGLAKVDPVDEFHEKVKEAVGLAEIVDGDDVRVTEPGEEAAFAGKTVSEPGIGDRWLREDLEGDKAFEFELAGFINEAHAALAYQFNNFELRESCGNGGERGRRGPRHGISGVCGNGGLREEAFGA
jgi:hypothetical protein